MPAVTLYTRARCHLCEVAKEVLDLVRGDTPFTLDVVDIESDPEIFARYRVEIPVITIDGRKAFKYRVDPAELRARLAYAAAGRYEPCTPPDEGSAS